MKLLSLLKTRSFWKKPRPFLISFFLLLGSVLIFFLILNMTLRTSFPDQIVIINKPNTKLAAVLPLVQGMQSYDVISDSSKTFKIIQVDLDPLDVKRGKTQTVTVWVEDTDNAAVTNENTVRAIVFQDNATTSFSFVLQNTEVMATGTVSVWQGSWVNQDSHNYRYQTKIMAKRIDNQHFITLSFR